MSWPSLLPEAAFVLPLVTRGMSTPKWKTGFRQCFIRVLVSPVCHKASARSSRVLDGDSATLGDFFFFKISRRTWGWNQAGGRKKNGCAPPPLHLHFTLQTPSPWCAHTNTHAHKHTLCLFDNVSRKDSLISKYIRAIRLHNPTRISFWSQVTAVCQKVRLRVEHV